MIDVLLLSLLAGALVGYALGYWHGHQDGVVHGYGERVIDEVRSRERA